MFSAGLNLDFYALKKVKFTFTSIAITGSMLSFILGYMFGISMGWNTIPSAFLGVMIMSTSSTMALKFIEDSNIKQDRSVTAIIGAVASDDIFGLICMTIVANIFLGEEVHIIKSVTGTSLIVAAMVISIYLGRKTIPSMLDITKKISPGSELLLVSRQLNYWTSL